MFGRWTTYRLRMQAIRQKYFTLMRKNVTTHRARILQDIRSKLFRGALYSIAFATTYTYANDIYSHYHETKQMKRKLLKQYPDQTFIVSFQEDPS